MWMDASVVMAALRRCRGRRRRRRIGWTKLSWTCLGLMVDLIRDFFLFKIFLRNKPLVGIRFHLARLVVGLMVPPSSMVRTTTDEWSSYYSIISKLLVLHTYTQYWATIVGTVWSIHWRVWTKALGKQLVSTYLAEFVRCNIFFIIFIAQAERKTIGCINKKQ